MITYRLTFIWRGLLYGILAGLVAAETYILLLAIISLAVEGFSGLFVFLGLGQIYGAVPASIVGGIAGLVIGLVFAVIGRNLPTKLGSALGFLIAGLLMPLTVVGLLRRDGAGLEGLRTDIQGFGIFELPILIMYLASGDWVGGRLSGGTIHLTNNAKRVVTILLTVLGLSVIGLLIFNVVFADHTQEITHQIKVLEVRQLSSDYSDKRCVDRGFKDVIVIEVVDEPGYEVQLCTDGASSYLMSKPSKELHTIKFVVHYERFRFRDFDITNLDDWTGRGAWNSHGTLPCVHWKEDKLSGSDCGGDRSQAATQRVFGYYR